jgi:hypothetical protein
MELKNSGYGTASFGLASLTALLMFILVIIAGVMQNSGNMNPNSSIAMMIGLAMFFFMFLDLVALVLGVIGLFQQDRKKLFAVLGIVIAGLTLLGTLGLVLLGLAMGG